jgi:hypothetical protein
MLLDVALWKINKYQVSVIGRVDIIYKMISS